MTASGFSYRTSKRGDVFIDHNDRHVVTLRGKAAERFLARVMAVDNEGAQLVMAKVTGNYKHGNERILRT